MSEAEAEAEALEPGEMMGVESDVESLEDNPQSQQPEESKTISAVPQMFTCEGCNMQFDSSSKKKTHKKKKLC